MYRFFICSIFVCCMTVITLSSRCGVQSTTDMTAIYVAPSGNDSWEGTKAKPFATLDRARDEIRRIKAGSALRKPVTVYLRRGVYELDKPFILTHEDSGTEACPVTYASYSGETAVISSGRKITGWKENTDGVWTVELPDVRTGNWEFRQLYVNGEARNRPRLPREGFYRVADYDLKGSAPWNSRSDWFRYTSGDINPEWKNIEDLEVVIPRFWVSSRQHIKSIDGSANTVTFTDSTRYRYSDDHTGKGTRYYMENVYEAFDEPGEWYLDQVKGELSYRPLKDETIDSVEIIAPVSTQIIRMEGDPAENKFVEHIVFSNLTFSHNNWSLPPGKVGDGQSAPEVEGALFMKGVRYCTISDCSVKNISSYAIQCDEGCMFNRFEQNELGYLGGGGIRMGGGSTYDHPLVRTGANEITDNHIHHIGLVHHAATGIWIQHGFGNHIAHNHIHHTYYSSIAIGWVWGYARSISSHNIIEYNHIHDVGQGMLSDMGGIYLLGIAPGTVVRNNVFHDISSHGYGGWGIYTDEGSTHVLIENNIVYRTKCGGFHQHYGRENIIRNNIFAFSTEGQIIRSRQEEHQSFVFENNIVYWTEGPLLGGNWNDDTYDIYNPFDWKRQKGQTYECDYNLYYNPKNDSIRFKEWTFEEWKARGRDVHSKIADPLFADPENGDFTLSPDSPALKLGFLPIDVSTVGPRK
ncbi:MAG: right-handed parallel beta-helix repeat-containing protein [Candidatus Latescibacteria bacterium]|nr:right-handed parallel beta-helix repeat-containing protein [Candidatus Latescibacterota bacterium]